MAGVTERFNESMLLIGRAIGLSTADMLYVGQRRDIPKAMARNELSNDWESRLREVDWLDFELHAQAGRLVSQYLRQLPQIAQDLPEYQAALADYSHPLWAERGPFRIGYGTQDIWAEFTGQHGEVRQLRELGP